MNIYEVFDTKEIKKLENIVGTIESREYTKEECNKFLHSILEDIMSKSYKNGDMDKTRQEFNGILRKLENWI